MVERRKLVESSQGEEYLHKDIWRVVQRQIDYAEANPAGALYDDLIVMVFAFHAIEGYLNYIGEKIAPDLWDDERRSSGSPGFPGSWLQYASAVALHRHTTAGIPMAQ